MLTFGLFGGYCSVKFLLWIQVFAGMLGIWAIVAMRIGNLSVSPEIKKGSLLVVPGLYRVIRHPMYTSLILVTLPLTIELPGFDSISIQLLLISVLLYKMLYEESLLVKHFPNYSDYMRKSWRIVPFVF